MRIAMIGPFGLYPKQTMRSRALPLARALVRRGHTVALFMPPWHTPETADQTWMEEAVHLRYVPLAGGPLAISWRLAREARNWGADVVHCFKPKAYSGLAAWWLWQLHRQRLRLVVDTDDWEGWGGWNEREPYTAVQKHFFAWQERWGMAHCHRLTVASRALQTIAWSLGLPPEQVVYLPNGPGITVPDPLPSTPAAPPTVLVYSRLFEFDTGRLVAILQQVQTAVPDLKILLVGAGLFADDAARFRQQLAGAGLLTAVEDAGWVEPAALPALLRRAHVGLYLMADSLLNRTKCPVKLADMVALGIPVVAEAVGQVPAYVRPGQTGRLRPPGDDAGLAADLLQLLRDDAARSRLAAGGIAHMQAHFSWDGLAARLEAAYA